MSNETSVFGDLQVGPQIEVFALVRKFNEDPFPEKVNLSVGGKKSVFFCRQYDKR